MGRVNFLQPHDKSIDVGKKKKKSPDKHHDINCHHIHVSTIGILVLIVKKFKCQPKIVRYSL